MIRVVLADDHLLVRQGVRSLLALAPDIHVVAEVANGDDAVTAVARESPDVCLFDVRMPGCSGIEALRRCRAAGHAAPTILLTTFDDDDALREGLLAGAVGYLLKDVELDALANAIRAAASGEPLIAAPARRTDLSPAPLDVASQNDRLTPREIEVVRLMAAGMSNREIAMASGVTEGTVKNHVSSVLSKLGVRDRTRAVLKALERQLI